MAKGKTMRHASALKALRQSTARRRQNQRFRSEVRTLTHQFFGALSNKKMDEAQVRFIRAQSAWQKAAKTGLIHRNAASRKISQMAAQLVHLSQR